MRVKEMQEQCNVRCLPVTLPYILQRHKNLGGWLDGLMVMNMLCPCRKPESRS